MVCPNCHRHTGGQSSLCEHCGTSLINESATEMVKPKKTTRKIVIMLICLIIAAFAAQNIYTRICRQLITQENLDELVYTIHNTATLAEDYFTIYFNREDYDAVDYSIKLEIAENKLTRERIYLRQVYTGCTNKMGWDEDKYIEYIELYNACCDLVDFVEDHDFSDPISTQATYDSLMKTYQKYYKRVN